MIPYGEKACLDSWIYVILSSNMPMPISQHTCFELSRIICIHAYIILHTLSEGKVNVDAIKALHDAVLDEFDYPDNVRTEITCLLNECEQMLQGVKLIQELSPKSLD